MSQNVKLDRQKDSAALLIHALSHDGRGIGTIEHKTTFVKGALPEESVTYKITQKRSTFNEAEVLDIITPSPDRVVPVCEHFGICGGCSLQHMGMKTQTNLKLQTLLEQLKHFGQVEPKELLPVLSSEAVGYRRKARLGVKFVQKKNKVLVGFREKSKRYLAELTRCAVLHPKIGEHLQELSELIASLKKFQHIPQIEVAMGDHDAALIFRHMEPLPECDREKLLLFGELNSIHIYLQPNSPLPLEKLWPSDSEHRLTYTLPDFGLEFAFHPLDFTQVNLAMNRLMVQQAIQQLDIKENETVLDLFCGIGNFTLPIAKFARQVTGIEGGENMVARAKENALRNNIANVNFYAANLMESFAEKPWMKLEYDKILLDPPRTGAKELLHQLTQFGAKRIVYVSCNPATLARDAGELVHSHGYQLMRVGIMNMFPHTSHIEAMAVFDKT